jgi:drug/metabolite transporter (DMT)-like permease
VQGARVASPRAIGLVFMLCSAVLFSAKAIFVKLSYPYGVDPLTLLTLRMALALPWFVVIALVEERRASEAQRATPLSLRWKVAALGAAGYWLASYLDFAGLAYVTASLERVVLFAYPTFTALLERVLYGKRLAPSAWGALALSYAGIAVALTGEVSATGTDAARGAGLVAASALAYAAFLVGSGRIIPTYGATRLVAHAMTAACLAVIAHFLLARPLSALAQPTAVYGYAALTAVVSTVLPTFLLGQGIRRLGASEAAIAASVGPISTLVRPDCWGRCWCWSG